MSVLVIEHPGETRRDAIRRTARALVLEQQEHYAETHPGTGTDQSVHGSGGGVKRRQVGTQTQSPTPGIPKPIRRLQEDPRSYFNLDKPHILISTESLKPIKQRKEGIVNARQHMALAADGEGGKRDPIKVQAGADGELYILDGNSTFAVAKENKWRSIPIELVPPEKGFGTDHLNDPHIDTWGELVHAGEVTMDESPDSYQAVLDLGEGLSAELPDAKVVSFEESLGEYDGPKVVFGPLKKAERAKEKVTNKYEGDWNKLGDMVRASVVAPPSKLDQIKGKVREHAEKRGWRVMAEENKIEQPTPVKYRDYSLALRSPDGLIAELQIVPPNMWKAKNTKGHKLYAEWRSFHEKGVKNEKTQELFKAQLTLYEEAWAEDSKL